MNEQGRLHSAPATVQHRRFEDSTARGAQPPADLVARLDRSVEALEDGDVDFAICVLTDLRDEMLRAA